MRCGGGTGGLPASDWGFGCIFTGDRMRGRASFCVCWLLFLRKTYLGVGLCFQEGSVDVCL